jgi:putrescine transport system permease protein
MASKNDDFVRSIARHAAAIAPYTWLVLFFLLPFLLVFKLSLSDTAVSIPPYTPRIDWSTGWAGFTDFLGKLDFANYDRLVRDSIYVAAFLSSLKVAIVSTVFLLLIGYPIAYGMARAPKDMRPILMMFVILPFWTSFLIRVYSWVGILRPEGLLNSALMGAGLIDQPLEIYATPTAVYIGIVYSYLPFMILPLFASLERLDDTLLEAAADLGCPPWLAFWRITLPQTIPGIIAGSMLCFIPIMGEAIIPDILGGTGTLMMGRTIWDEFNSNRDWPAASAVAIVLLLILLVPILYFQRIQARELEASK